MRDPVPTWQNVTGAGGGNAAVPAMAQASQNFRGMFSDLQDVLKQREATDTANVGQMQDNGRQAYFEALGGAKTPEQLAQLQQSGALEQLRTGMDAGSLAATRDSADARQTLLRQQLTQANAFSDAQRKYDQAPDVDKIRAFQQQGQYAEADKIMGSRTDWLDRAGLVKSGIDSRRTIADAAYNAEIQPLNLATAKLALTATKVAAQDSAETRELNGFLADKSAGYLAGQAAKGASHYDTAKRMGFPVSETTKLPKFNSFEPEQLLRYNHDRILNNLPTSENFASGDSVVANKFKAELVKSGKFSPRVLQANEDTIMKAFDTTKLSATTGNDDANSASARYDRAVRTAQTDAAYASTDKDNWFAPGDASAKEQYKELTTAAKIKELAKGAPEDEPYISTYITNMSTKGVEVSPGKFLIPSAAAVEASLRDTREWWVQNDGHAYGAEKRLKEIIKGVNVEGMVKQGEASKSWRLKQDAIKRLLGASTAVDAQDKLNPNAPR